MKGPTTPSRLRYTAGMNVALVVLVVVVALVAVDAVMRGDAKRRLPPADQAQISTQKIVVDLSGRDRD